MNNMKIMVVDDDTNISELITLYLNKEGYIVKQVADGGEVLDEFEKFKPDLILLDIMLPNMDGNKICNEIKKISKTPIIMLTAKGEVTDKVLSLDLGADDYMVKPFDTKELIARVKAILRRFNVNSVEDITEKIELPNISIDLKSHIVEYCGQKITLPLKEFEVLTFLATNPNQVFTRDQLLDKVWGYKFSGDTRTVDVHIKRIREKLASVNSEKDYIKTIWGLGYKFEVDIIV